MRFWAVHKHHDTKTICSELRHRCGKKCLIVRGRYWRRVAIIKSRSSGRAKRAHFRTTKAAVKMHTLLDLRGNATNQPFPALFCGSVSH